MGYLHGFISCYPVLGQCFRTIPTENWKNQIFPVFHGVKKRNIGWDGLSIKKYHIQKITSRQTSFPQLSWFSVKVFSKKIVQWTHILIWKHLICSQVFLAVTRPFLNKVFDCVSIGKSNIWKWELRKKYSQNLIFYIM